MKICGCFCWCIPSFSSEPIESNHAQKRAATEPLVRNAQAFSRPQTPEISRRTDTPGASGISSAQEYHDQLSKDFESKSVDSSLPQEVDT